MFPFSKILDSTAPVMGGLGARGVRVYSLYWTLQGGSAKRGTFFRMDVYKRVWIL